MAASLSGINPFTVNQAYHRSLLFDQLKKKESEAGAADSALSVPEKPREKTEYSEGVPAAEKPDKNAVPFKPGFVFEYGQGAENGPVIITITDNERIRVDHKGAELSEERKRSIRSLVMLGVGKLDREGFNALMREGKTNAPDIRNELSLMGINPALPFGLGEDFHYFNAKEELSLYRKMDVKG